MFLIFFGLNAGELAGFGNLSTVSAGFPRARVCVNKADGALKFVLRQSNSKSI